MNIFHAGSETYCYESQQQSEQTGDEDYVPDAVYLSKGGRGDGDSRLKSSIRAQVLSRSRISHLPNI